MAAVPELPVELRTFDAFAERHWLHPLSGACEPAVWHEPAFPDRVESSLTAALKSAADGNLAALAEAHLLAAALVGHRPAVRPETIRDLAAVLADPSKTSVGRDATRAARLRGGPAAGELQLVLALEAVRPTPSELPYGDELQELLDRAAYRDAPLAGVVSGLLMYHGRSDVEPTAQIRAAIANQTAPKIDWAGDLVKLRKQVLAEVKRITLNAGSAYVGKYRHCGTAWNRFMTECVLAFVPAMYPDNPKGWDAARVQKRIERLPLDHAEIADALEAREKSRRMMDRAVDRLVELLTETNEAYRQTTKSGERENRPSMELVAETRTLLAGTPAGDAVERLAHMLLERVLGPKPPAAATAHPLTLGAGVFVTFPALLDHLEEAVDPAAPPLAGELGGDARRAAAVLLYPKARPTTLVSWDTVEQRARDDLRFDRVARLKGEVPPGDHTAAAQETNRLLVEKDQKTDRLRRAWRGLQALGVPSHRTNLDAVKWAAADTERDDVRLIGAWLDRTAAASEKQLKAAVAAWDAELSADPDGADRLADLRAGRYDRAVRGGEGAATADRPLRETAWRKDAAAAFPNPLQVLRDLAPTTPVAKKWTADLSDKTKHPLLSLRVEFAKWVFGGEDKGSLYEERDKSDQQTARFCVETELVRRHLSALQPTYLPQLHAARYLVVVAAPELPDERDYPHKIVETAVKHGKNAVVAVLCPGMADRVRADVRRRLQNSNLLAGTVDDLDLCRLLNPDGVQPNLVLGLLEVILEQQPWRAANPFSLPEGSEMRLEMYVGRRDEAKELATTPHKTRLFSGRKLGKTALLQFILRTYDGDTLPSGHRLRVVYVSIVGVDREDLFATRLLAQLRRDFPEARLPEVLSEPAAIIDALSELLKQRPGDDLLIVIDEADAFVDAQVRQDRLKKGTGLSWKLRENPRVRYVFTGYWATDTRDGVWYNWGDVLELSQLLPEDAAGLIARPLARLGIDAADQAAEIAFRCGSQPAVLLRFGERLVERMAEDGFKDGARVDHDLVQDTFEDAKVQTEIQGVVRANFQGDPFGQAVFAVVLRESARAPLGRWLRNLDQTTVEVFRQYLTGDQPGLPAEVKEKLRNMHRRKLLRRRTADGQPEYQLKFPHHLATLLADLQLEMEIRTNLRAWWETHASAGDAAAAEGRSPLRRSDLAAIRDTLRPELADVAPAVVAVGSVWADALAHESGGVAARLGLPAPRAASEYRPGSPARCWTHAGPDDLTGLLDTPPAARPVVLIGGVDLLRAALARRNRNPGDAEAFGPNRMSDGRVRWWFQRILGVEFAREQVYDRVHKETAGVPLLVGEFQALLFPNGPPPGGATPSGELVEQTFAAFARKLSDPAFAAGVSRMLTERERNLLRMTRVVTKFWGADTTQVGGFLAGGWSEADFGAEWAEAYPGRPFPPSYLTQAEDPVALETLLAAGLLAATDATGGPVDRVLPLPADDPVVALLAGFR